MYAAVRNRLLDLAPTLDDGQQAAPLPATPPWTVVDGYRHLTGVCADSLDGGTDGAASPAWTAAQLEARADRSLAEVCDEWAQRGPDLDAVLQEAGADMGWSVLDAWVHEQDIRAAAGVGALHDDELLTDLVPLALGAFGGYYAKAGGPVLRLVLDGESRTLGDGEPKAELTSTPYEMLRIVFGRRSERQVADAGWSGPDALRRSGRFPGLRPPDRRHHRLTARPRRRKAVRRSRGCLTTVTPAPRTACRRSEQWRSSHGGRAVNVAARSAAQAVATGAPMPPHPTGGRSEGGLDGLDRSVGRVEGGDVIAHRLGAGTERRILDRLQDGGAQIVGRTCRARRAARRRPGRWRQR